MFSSGSQRILFYIVSPVTSEQRGSLANPAVNVINGEGEEVFIDERGVRMDQRGDGCVVGLRYWEPWCWHELTMINAREERH